MARGWKQPKYSAWHIHKLEYLWKREEVLYVCVWKDLIEVIVKFKKKSSREYL